MLVDLPTYIKQKYTFAKKSNKTFEETKEQPEKQDKLSINLLYFTPFLSVSVTEKPREIVKNHISCDNVSSLSHPSGEVPHLHFH